MPRKSKVLPNQRFGKLVAIRKVSPIGSKNSKWLCRCDCGNTTEVLATSLSNNRTKSCGCLRSVDLTNQRFGRLVAIKKVNTTGEAKWLCQCDCGKMKTIRAGHLLKGETKSCGCMYKERIKDLTNQKFGRLVALKKVNTTGPSKWLCQCDCGNTKIVSATNLMRGEVKSCGCLITKDLTNQRFGKLVAIRKVSPIGSKNSRWLCQCDCGNTKDVLANRLIRGTTKSCGCTWKKDLTNQRFGRLVVIRRVNTKENSGWLCQCDCGNTKVIKTGNLIAGDVKSCGCYHRKMRSIIVKKAIISRQKYKIDGAYTPSLTAKIHSNNTSGYKGVHYRKSVDRWIARITLKRKMYYLGSYRTKGDAIKARQRAEEELFEPILEKYAELQKNNNK